ncbi:MAG: hypothetical protein OXJ53_15030 [Gammaproteobacteria bacterium]|nr:hypothetical protein [Gammaproteobacteria bacterium]MDE0270046.1 hypothetical protein [Gammaproteobacteria bacterium]
MDSGGLPCHCLGWLVATEPTPQATRNAPVFDYTPPESDRGNVDITLAVVGSRFEAPAPVFWTFAANMSKDFVEVLNAIGFRVQGPFDSYDQMTFPQKEGSELILSAEYDFSYDTSALQATSDTGGALLGALIFGSQSSSDSPRYRFSGPVTVRSRVTLVLYESLSRERMWTKSLSFEPIQVALQGTYAFPDRSLPSLEAILSQEDQFYNDLSTQLEARYQEAMRSTYAYLDPKEVAMVSRQADSLRQRKRY